MALLGEASVLAALLGCLALGPPDDWECTPTTDERPCPGGKACEVSAEGPVCLAVCMRSSDCEGADGCVSEVCKPYGASCSDHPDCIEGFYCAVASGQCVKNPPGFSDCTIDTDNDSILDCFDTCVDADEDGVGNGTNGNSGCAVQTVVDSNDEDPEACADTDGDTCDDCVSQTFDPANDDADADGVCDAYDVCVGHDDSLDGDSDGVPDGCDPCPQDNPDDSDLDTVCDTDDVCEGHDDQVDADGDGVPDGCDECVGHDDSLDGDSDGVPDGCDDCPGQNDTVDVDSNGTPDCLEDLLINPQFTTDVSDWLSGAQSTISWSSEDADGSEISGSAEIVNQCPIDGGCSRGSQQCVNVGASVPLAAYAQTYVPPGQPVSGGALMTIMFRDGPCSGGSNYISSVAVGGSGGDGWVLKSRTGIVTPMGTQSVRICLDNFKDAFGDFTVRFDNVLLRRDD